MLFPTDFLTRLEYLSIISKRVFRGSLLAQRRTMQLGSGIEFSDHREYSPGDDFRYLDWNIYARHGDLLLKRFQEEQDLHVAILLDTSSSMFFSGDSKIQMSKSLAISLGYVALSDGDSVIVSLLGNKNTPRYTGQRAVSRLQKEVLQAEESGNFDFEKEIIAAASKLKMPGKCFVISDFLFSQEAQAI